ncbi:hypothetical protein [Alicyclobacillus vulcanalis]|uniref:Uncharacterized protein n=1 Tax=Alicyclobacillus vulcanalis TaxID=252246 RepID=A0A1N7M390_9BACL|nr:hypothetical protein [Alicyclobacillus vulcanalis]SIS80548.1 hypothetical protein SAMN05421799_104192 [Alicyclobacillus vulcanalis]
MATIQRNHLRRVRTAFLSGAYPDGPMTGRVLAAVRLPRGGSYQVWIGCGDEVGAWARRVRGKFGGTAAVGTWVGEREFEVIVERWRPISPAGQRMDGKRAVGLARPLISAMAVADRYFLVTTPGALEAEIVVRDTSGERWSAGTWRDYLVRQSRHQRHKN